MLNVMIFIVLLLLCSLICYLPKVIHMKHNYKSSKKARRNSLKMLVVGSTQSGKTMKYVK